MSRLDRFNQALVALGVNPDFFWKCVRDYEQDHDLHMMEKLERRKHSFKDTLLLGFSWYHAPEGPVFWRKIEAEIGKYDDK